jgi:dolichol-phosphate mannosyltransferase
MEQPSEISPADALGRLELSVVVPFYNEGANVQPLVGELRAALDLIGTTSEVLAIDDGSSDRTGPELDAAARAWPALHVIHFRRNRGQAAALWYGFQHAHGAWIAMLDGDGQNPPAELGRLWSVRDTADMVAGARAHRHDSILRRTMSLVANRVRRAALCDGVSDTGCSLKLFRHEVALSFLPIRTMYSFLPAFAVAAGYTVREISVAHRPRRAGVSKYGLGVMAVLPLLDLVSLCWLLRRTVRQNQTGRGTSRSLNR